MNPVDSAHDSPQPPADHTTPPGQPHAVHEQAGHAQTVHGHATHEHVGHVVPLGLLIGVFAALMVLTVLTVAAVNVDLGYNANLAVALGIAVVKGGLVCLYFMHLRWDNPFNTIAVLVSLVFVGLFIAVAVLDTGQYRRSIDPPGGWNRTTVDIPSVN